MILVIALAVIAALFAMRRLNTAQACLADGSCKLDTKCVGGQCTTGPVMDDSTPNV
jgi:hypothetical protein